MYALDPTVLHWKHFVLLFGKELPDIESIYDPEVVLQGKKQVSEQLHCYKKQDAVFLVLCLVLHQNEFLVLHTPVRYGTRLNICKTAH